MITLSDRKINHLREIIACYYDQDNEADRADWASTIVGVLDYIIDTEDAVEAQDGTEW